MKKIILLLLTTLFLMGVQAQLSTPGTFDNPKFLKTITTNGTNSVSNSKTVVTNSTNSISNGINATVVGLSKIYSATGNYTLSADGKGASAATMNIRVNKPNSTATVEKAILISAVTGGTIGNGCVSIAGVPINWDGTAASSYFKNYWADVTSIVASQINSFPAGISNIALSECNSGAIDGEALLVVFKDAAATEKTIIIMFGAANPLGDNFSVSLAQPIDPSASTALLDMGLGIGFSYQQSGGSQTSLVSVNGQRLSSSAGGEDDGAAANGALITVGGIGDLNNNPSDPNAGPSNPRTDDELYNILPFINNTTTNLTITTLNPSTDDNIFLAYFALSGAAIIGEGALLSQTTISGNTGTTHTVKVDVKNANGLALANKSVTFTISAGPNAALAAFTTTTDVNGQAYYTYTGNGGAGTDNIQACFVNSQSQSSCSNTTSFEWIAALQPPSIACAENISVNNTVGQCGAIVTYAPAIAGGSTAATITYSIESGSYFAVGTTPVIATATDANGSTSCTFNVTVVDAEAPVINALANISVLATSAAGTAVSFTAPIGTDNCSAATTIQKTGLASGSIFPIGTTTNTFIVTDAAGLIASSSFTVTVIGIAPVIVVPANIIANNGTGICGAVVNFAATETTGIPASNITYSIASGTVFAVGTTTVTATATNAIGVSNNTFTITVKDNTKPVVIAPAAITVSCGTVLLPTNTGMASATDNCSAGVVLTYSDDKTLTVCGGSIVRTWTATDAANNVSTATQIITVSPAQLPTMIAPSAVTISVPCGATPLPSTLPFTNGLSDGCLLSGVSNPSTFVTIAGTCGGTLTETWTATDNCGRALASVSRTVTVSQNLGMVQNFVLYSGIGAVSNTGTSDVTGDIGTNLGVVSGFTAPTIFTGSMFNATSTTTQAKIDLLNLYIHLSNIPVTNTTHAAVFGSNETITAGVYTVPGAGSMTGNLNLDGQGNTNAVIILKFNGAFSPAAGSTITLTNGIRASNVFWIAEGAISIGASSTMKGTFIAHTGAATMGASGDLEGRLVSTVGAVSFGPGKAYLPSGLSTIPVICVNSCNNSILGSASNFTLFTSVGAVSNTGSTGIIGNIGTGAGAITGFETPVTTLVGISYNADAVTAQASSDLLAAYTQLVNIPTTNSAHTATFGSGETLMPGVYAIGAAGSLAGTITLDGGGNPNAQFIFKFNGAFVAGAQSKIILTNGASHCNVFWIAEGAISMGTFSFMKGTFIANNGANTMGANGNLEGSMFSTAGAIGFNTGVGYNSYALCANSNPAATYKATSNATLKTDNTVSIETKLSAYPNPSRNKVNLVFTGDVSKVTSVEMLNVLGKRVFVSPRFQSSINLSNITTGMYYLSVYANAKAYTVTVIVEK